MTVNLEKVKKDLLEQRVIHIEVLKEIKYLLEKLKEGLSYQECKKLAINNNNLQLVKCLEDLAALRLIEHLGEKNVERDFNNIQPDWHTYVVEPMGEDSDYLIFEA